MPRHRKTLAAALSGAVAVAGATAVLAGAQDTPSAPAVTIAAAGSKTTVTGADALQQGITKLTFTSTAKETDFTVFALKAGATEAQVGKAAAKLKGPPTSLQKYGRFLTGASPGKGHPYSASVDLRKGDYLVIDSTKAPKFVGRFTVGSGATTIPVPDPDATVTMRDFRFTGPATLPSTGIIRVVNAGRSPHFIVMARATSAAAAKKAASALHMGSEKQAMKYLAGDEFGLAALISPDVVNDVDVEGLKKGSWVIVCFYGDERSKGKEHAMLGMEKVVTVR